MVGTDSESEKFNNHHIAIIEAQHRQSVHLNNRKQIAKNCSPLRRSQRIGGFKANFYDNEMQQHNDKNNEIKNFKKLRQNFKNIEIDNSFDKSNNINNNSKIINKNEKNYQLHENNNNHISIDNNKKVINNNSDNEIKNNNKILISNKFNMVEINESNNKDEMNFNNIITKKVLKHWTTLQLLTRIKLKILKIFLTLKIMLIF
jgi:hypothetical protein